MKTKILFSVIFIMILTACEKTIYVDLNSKNPLLIVEANITNQPGPYIVKLSNSVNYYSDNYFPAVSGALVSISDNSGNSETLTEISPGNYKTNTLQGVSGRSYALNITTNDEKNYSAISFMPDPVAIDSVNFQPNNDSTRYRVICKFQDPPGVFNYYKLQLSSPDTVNLDSTNIRILADGFADGQELSLTYRTHLIPGDSVTVKLEGIDKATYDFYRTLPNVEGALASFASAPPANPVTNLTNGALGYFSAHSVSVVHTVVH